MKKTLIMSVPFQELRIEPSRGFVHLERVDPDRTAGGIEIPEQARESNLPRFLVLAVGPQEEPPFPWKVGDEVLVAPQLGSTFVVPIPGKHQCICSSACVFARVSSLRN